MEPSPDRRPVSPLADLVATNAARTLALDAMGGDIGIDAVVPAAIDAVRSEPDLSLILVGDAPLVQAALDRSSRHLSSAERERVRVHHASQRVEMDEPPAQAMRLKKDSSMRVALDLVQQGAAQACVSAGNTGALMATARYVLKTLPGIDRPAICTLMPTLTGRTYMLDLGANVDCEPQHLLQFALMGATLARAAEGLSEPRVALLNIGSEAIKGNEVVKEAAALITNSGLNFAGYIEGDRLYQGDVDVVVCDGFVGNVALKTSEGVARVIGTYLKDEFKRNAFTLALAALVRPVMSRFKARIDPRRYNGASFIGLRGVVVKSHGSADAFAFGRAIRLASLEARKKVPERIRDQLERASEEQPLS